MKHRIWNPCRSGLPAALAQHPAIVSAWDGLDPQQVWDSHVHLAGIGDSESGIRLAPASGSFRHPLQFLQRLFFLNSACVPAEPGRADHHFVERLLHLLESLRPGVKLLLLSLDRVYTPDGQAHPASSSLYVPNSYARSLAQRYPRAFAWAASIHPYRRDALDALERASSLGARAVKWLPPAMGIDPASPLCDPFYRSLAQLDMPLICHAGEEKALHGAGAAHLGNPLRLRRALDAGVRVVMAHCASLGKAEDFDRSGQMVPSFSLFARMMDAPAHRGLLFADISAITMRNRPVELVRAVLQRTEWHPRLLNGSDYPLPGCIPLFSPIRFIRAGLLPRELGPVLAALQGYNPLLFDFVLKRHLRANGHRLPIGVFATRPFFERAWAENLAGKQGSRQPTEEVQNMDGEERKLSVQRLDS